MLFKIKKQPLLFPAYVNKVISCITIVTTTSELSSRLPARMSSEKTALVKDLIASDKVVIFSKTYCPYCKLAKDVFEKVKQKVTVIELDNRDDGDEIQDVLASMTGARTVPRVFVDGNCLGGGTDVKSLHERGELLKLLA